MIRLLFAAIGLFLLAGCTSTLSGTNQLYGAQVYLPLPKKCQDDPASCAVARPANAAVSTGSATTLDAALATSECVAGVMTTRYMEPALRDRFRINPGMGLSVGQTSYSANSSEQFPVMTHWDWRVPVVGECRDGYASIPQWGRDDLLVLRYLLTSAHLMNSSDSEPVRPLSPDYFAKAIIAAGDCDHPQSCLEQQLFMPFVNGLYIDVRELAGPGPEGEGPIGTAGQNLSANGLGAWMNQLFEPAKSDIAMLKSDPVCSQVDPGYDANNPSVSCAFNQARLGWQGDVGGLPGDALSGYTDLTLLTTGDPLLAMRPPRSVYPLDPANTVLRPCNDAQADCRLAKPMVRGFTDIELTIPVMVRSVNDYTPAQLRMIPVHTTLAEFARQNGEIRYIERSLQWFPETIATEKNAKVGRTKLANSRGRIRLFPGRKGSGKGIVLPPGAADDILLAPGDIIVLRAP